MARITVTTVIDAPPAAVWADLQDIASHVEWMADATAVRFTTEERTGVGTRFECDTAVGPFRLTDRMEITRWEPSRAMGVRHTGLVTGEGTFRLHGVGNHPDGPADTTAFVWSETLTFPWWMGGPVGALLARPVLTAVWRRNLGRLRARFAP